jgi:hypothetical protein
LTKDIGLVLISSSLILSGCWVRPDDEEKKKKDDQDPAQPVASHHYIGHGYRWAFGWNGGGGAIGARPGIASPAGSLRGGFGAIGHAAAVSS